ncbi:MAG: DUF393 domain-containing protein [Pseudomonadota bacterium]
MAEAQEQSGCDLTVYFDGSCPLCRAEIDYFQKRTANAAVRFEDVSKPQPTLVEGLDPTHAMKRFHVYRSDGTLLSGAAGFAEMWARAPGWWWLARLSRVPGVLWVMERGYRGFLVLRPLLVRVLSPILRRRTQGAKVSDA